MKNLRSRFSFAILILVFLFSSCQEDAEVPLDPSVALELTDLSYGMSDRKRMDVFLPANRSSERTKVLIWIHGGAWIDGDKSEFRDFKPLFESVQEDYAYISINYRLFNLVGNLNKFPSQEDDVKAAIKFIRSKLSEWNVSDKVVLAGASAGGHLALLHSYKNDDNFVDVCVALFPPTDLIMLAQTNAFAGILLNSMIGDINSQQQLYIDSSPLNFITNNSVPTAFFHGTIDTVVPVSQSQELERVLGENNVSKLVQYFPGKGHGFSDQTYLALLRDTETFIRQHLP
ncbi:alpha/beta hydrolase [Mongoliitalea daihaiensis]|uniref:alpha/beta hydrolase n=1 Tax=Mongoliitalea daihaiensis TaxID=2782006 RepID=UPI001F3379CD|nr:alpha/beta hydrolase [Mongoliitalea daihaiensis]UJP65984.1 alpha/beta hydrolase [Mongoliitalea daihaiensis]